MIFLGIFRFTTPVLRLGRQEGPALARTMLRLVVQWSWCVPTSCTSHRRGALLAYNVVLDECSQVGGKGFPVTHRRDRFGLYLHGNTLFRYRGRVFVALAQYRIEGICDIPEGFAVWELQPHTDGFSVDWVEVARAPLDLLQDFVQIDVKVPCCKFFEVKIVSSGGLICMTARDDDDYFLPLLCDLDQGAWYRIPPPPYQGRYSNDLSVVLGVTLSLVTTST
ncbi:hypothetical protein GOP47_0027005 [Adiantum capillus-veneris]|nr:hypothetical protein GOP47_0027005 [Adiantum capillus-veneris]